MNLCAGRLKLLQREWRAILILVVGAALRFWQLGEFPFHPDEAQHAWFTMGLRDYHYDPIYHGPLLYHLVFGVFSVFGISDFTARFVPAALGVLLLWMVLFPARRYLGVRAALLSGALLSLSPIIVAYSRRLLHDSLVLVLTFGAVLCFQAALNSPSSSRVGRNARLGLAAILPLFIATKANVFFIVAMLAAFWVWDFLFTKRERSKHAFDVKTPLLCLAVGMAVFVLLFRGDSFRALPEMIGYWGGQQREPRLPGPHDYYLRLLLLYELPLFLAAIWGAFCALWQRTPFGNLLLWWGLSSLALYAVANEKVPWLLAHQVLPLALLGGIGLAQIRLKTPVRFVAFGTAALLGVVFSSRHVMATNFENAADRHEPLLFAQTTTAYRDEIIRALRQTQPINAGVWVSSGEQWPAAWYLRPDAGLVGDSPVLWDATPPFASSLRVVITSSDEWKVLQANGRFYDWNGSVVARYVWPRPAWSALRPQTFARFWWQRQASMENGVLSEESSMLSVIATSPIATH